MFNSKHVRKMYRVGLDEGVLPNCASEVKGMALAIMQWISEHNNKNLATVERAMVDLVEYKGEAKHINGSRVLARWIKVIQVA